MRIDKHKLTDGTISIITNLLKEAAPNLTNDSLFEAIQNYPQYGSYPVTQTPKRGLTRKEAAQRLSMSLPTIDRLCASGKLEKVTVGTRLVRITESSVEQLLQGGALTQQAETGEGVINA